MSKLLRCALLRVAAAAVLVALLAPTAVTAQTYVDCFAIQPAASAIVASTDPAEFCLQKCPSNTIALGLSPDPNNFALTQCACLSAIPNAAYSSLFPCTQYCHDIYTASGKGECGDISILGTQYWSVYQFPPQTTTVPTTTAAPTTAPAQNNPPNPNPQGAASTLSLGASTAPAVTTTVTLSPSGFSSSSAFVSTINPNLLGSADQVPNSNSTLSSSGAGSMAPSDLSSSESQPQPLGTLTSLKSVPTMQPLNSNNANNNGNIGTSSSNNQNSNGTNTTPSTGPTSTGFTVNVIFIVVGILGLVCGVALALFMLWQKRRRAAYAEAEKQLQFGFQPSKHTYALDATSDLAVLLHPPAAGGGRMDGDGSMEASMDATFVYGTPQHSKGLIDGQKVVYVIPYDGNGTVTMMPATSRLGVGPQFGGVDRAGAGLGLGAMPVVLQSNLAGEDDHTLGKSNDKVHEPSIYSMSSTILQKKNYKDYRLWNGDARTQMNSVNGSSMLSSVDMPDQSDARSVANSSIFMSHVARNAAMDMEAAAAKARAQG